VYSIYRKYIEKGLALDAIYDICACRIIVKTPPECYNVFGLVHDLYIPVPGTFKDYIQIPKPNGYQSLHTVVQGEAGIRFEVQIRTEAMDESAEYGVAAHWKYKDKLKGKQHEEVFAWVRQLLENQQDVDAEDFISNIKVDLFADEVYVFSPKGDIYSLPQGATPIDFAYAIHSAIGNRMTGAKVNGRIVPIDYELKTGEMVDIITAKNAAGPKRDWMQIAKTSAARSKIRQWFKKERREENIEQGKNMLDKELRAAFIYDSFHQPDFLAFMLKQMGYPSISELHAGIGYGGITAAKVVHRAKEELARRQKVEAPEIKLPPIKKKAVADTGVIVEGIDNCLVKFAKCCTPIPGDAIIGFVTRGHGVSVHRGACPNAKASLTRSAADYDRWINVEWEMGEKHRYHTAIRITAKNRPGVLSNLVTVLGNMKINVNELSVRDNQDGQNIYFMTITVYDRGQLDLVMQRLRRTSAVTEVVRAMSGDGGGAN
jgi:GTP pyrophosphokinase